LGNTSQFIKHSLTNSSEVLLTFINMSESAFLKAEWRNLVLVNYEFDPAVLQNYLPAHTELDTFNNIHYISLVGFLFKDTRVKGVIVPFHRTFEEVNLRFYIKYNDHGKWKRGVAFIKEIVPKKLVAMVANKIFGENYRACKMRHQWFNSSPEKLSVEYMWKDKGDWNWIAASAESKSHFPKPETEENFICEHFWGYTRGKNTTTEYEVHHPTWRLHKVTHCDTHCDFAREYGKDFALLNTTKPISVFLAEGSEISVGSKRVIEMVTV